MFDAGLRITEALSLQIKHLDFPNSRLKVRTLKKGKTKTGEPIIKFRYIPMSSRLISAIGDFWKLVKNKKNPDSYIFPSNPKFKPKEPFLSRKVVGRRIKYLSGGLVNPHMLRHSFATRIVEKTKDIKMAMELLGHASIKTTQIYIHVAEDKKRFAIDLIEPKTKMQRIKERFMPEPQKIFIKPVAKGLTKVHVGRKQEIADLHRKIEMKINTLIEGPQGIGKSHLLDNSVFPKVLRIDDFKGLTTTLKGMIIKLRADKESEVDLVLEVDNEAVRKSQIERLNLLKATRNTEEVNKCLVNLTNAAKSGKENLLDLAVKYNITRKAGSFYSYGEHKLGQGREKVKMFLSEHTKVRDSIEKDVKTLVFGSPKEIAKLTEKLQATAK